MHGIPAGIILLSDTLGLSSLVNALHDRRATEDGTKSSLVGPFYRQDSPSLKLGDTIVTKPTNGMEVCLYGRVSNAAGRSVPHATVQVWQPDKTGNYDLQKHDPSEMDLRGTFKTDSDGRFYLRTIAPLGYMIPMDGPVGDMIRAQKRHGYRPAHIHFIIGADGYREVVTALYLQGDKHIDSVTVFEDGVRVDVLIALQIQCRHYFAIAIRADDEMDMRGAIAVAFLRADHVAHRAVHRDHVAEWSNGAEIEPAVGISLERAAQIHLGGIMLLQIVVACFVRLPDLDRGMGDAAPGSVGYAAIEANFHAVGGLGDDGVAQLQRR